jgi:flagellar biosynthesis repressor protein FlbT
MALKIVLKPGERIIIGGAVITNGKTTAQLLIENNVPILRQKQIMSENEASTPCRRIYLVIQLMYIDAGNLAAHHHTYWNLVRDVLTAAPSTLPIIDRISDHILNNRYYQALKLTKKLIEYEEETVAHVRHPNRNV